MKKTELYLTLDIFTNEDDPISVAKVLGGSPHRVYLKGDLVSAKAKIRFKENGLEYRHVSPELNLNISIEKFLAEIESPHVKKILKKYRSEFCVILYAVDRSAELWISPQNLKKVGELGLDFGIDYYIFP
jgi:hypothetical protein